VPQPSPEVTVACVLRSGKRFIDKQPYRVEHAVKLRNGVARHLPVRHRFVCLTDQMDEVLSAGIIAVPLAETWGGWWSKINLFTPTLLTGPTLYMDLDTLVVGDLTPLVRTTPGITMVKDFYSPDTMNSSTMAWMGDYSAIWHRFKKDPEGITRRYDRLPGSRVGDQGFIHDVLNGAGARIDTFDPAYVVSFKQSARQGPPENARVISYHGRPKIDDPAAGWSYEAWSAL